MVYLYNFLYLGLLFLLLPLNGKIIAYQIKRKKTSPYQYHFCVWGTAAVITGYSRNEIIAFLSMVSTNMKIHLSCFILVVYNSCIDRTLQTLNCVSSPYSNRTTSTRQDIVQEFAVSVMTAFLKVHALPSPLGVKTDISTVL